MAWSREEALTDPAVRNPLMFASEFRFQLRDIPTEIIVRLYRPLHSGSMVVRQSHHVLIPGLAAPPPPRSPEPGEKGDDPMSNGEGETLHRVIDEMVQAYNAARAQGLEPNTSWLRPNETFA